VLWEFTLFVALLLVLFLAVVDLAVTRGDDGQMGRVVDATAEALATNQRPKDLELDLVATGGSLTDEDRDQPCTTVGLPEGSSELRDAICLVKLGVATTGNETRVRIVRDGDEVVACAMMRPRSVTGLLAPIQDHRTQRAVATRTIDGGSTTVETLSETTLPEADWDFCPTP
jgi:hypothetical protein